MNPRDFCREAGYTSALLLTFQFDPFFFERVGLVDLIAGGTGDILVIADAKQIFDLSSQWERQLRGLGRRYQLVPAATKSIFHSKVILRMGKEGGAIWVSSGNLTFGGWGGNKELASAWEVGLGKQDDGAWVSSFLKRVQSWCANDLQHDVIRRMLETPWIRNTNQPSSVGTILTSYDDMSLKDEIEKRWYGRRFEEVKIFTGSTDESGSVLEWLHKAFGVNKAVIILDESRARFSPEKLSRLPLEIQVKHFPGTATMHAKFFWFAGETSSAAAFGSANCSAAAWLIPPRFGGNIETINVYDEAQPAEFEFLLSVFLDESLPIANLTDAQPAYIAVEEKPIEAIPVAEIAFENSTGEFRVKFIQEMMDLEALSIQISESIYTLTPLNEEKSLWASQETGIVSDKVTLFVSLKLEFKYGSQQRKYWVNDIGELKHNSLSRHIQDTLSALSNPPQSLSEQNKILAQLHQIAVSLISEPESFPDSLKVLHDRGKDGNEKATPSKPVNPEELLRSLDEIKSKSKSNNPGQPTFSLSLIGVMRALFDFVESEGIEDELISEEIEAEKEEDDSLPEDPSPQQEKTKKGKAKESDARYKKKISAQIEDFFDKLTAPKFAETATATQTVQASAFPLAVIFYGIRGGWVENKLAQDWSMRIFDILFHQSYPGNITGLLNYVHKRYCEDEKQEEFARIVGDGTLWLALLCSIASTSWKGQNADFRKAFALRSILKAEDLIASTNAGQMAGLVTRIEESRVRPVFTQAPIADRLLNELENILKRDKDDLFYLQENAQYDFEVGDLLWMAPRNWAECLEASSLHSNFLAHLHLRATSKKVSGKYFLNVTKVTIQREDISRIFVEMNELSSLG